MRRDNSTANNDRLIKKIYDSNCTQSLNSCVNETKFKILILIVRDIQIVKNRDFFLQDKNRFERPEQL